MDIKVNTGTLQSAVEELLREYGDVVYKATEEGLDAAEKVLLSALKDASPTRKGGLKRSWKGSGKKYKLARYVGNTKTVSGKNGEIPLLNILEYSTTRGKPFVRKTFDANIDNMANAVVETIKKEV